MVLRPNKPLIIALRAPLIARAKHLGSRGSSFNQSRLRRRLLETVNNIRLDILVSSIHLDCGKDSALAKFCSWDRSGGRVQRSSARSRSHSVHVGTPTLSDHTASLHIRFSHMQPTPWPPSSPRFRFQEMQAAAHCQTIK